MSGDWSSDVCSSDLYGPLPPVGLCEMTMADEACSRDKDQLRVQPLRTPPSPGRNPNAPGTHQMPPNLLFYPVSDKRKAVTRIADGKVVHPTP